MQMIFPHMFSQVQLASNFKIIIILSVITYNVETNIFIICGSQDIFLTRIVLKFRIWFESSQRLNIETVAGNFKIDHVLYITGSV